MTPVNQDQKESKLINYGVKVALSYVSKQGLKS